MAIVKPFRALRPQRELAEKVASPPYDVISSNEAREKAANNPISFLHINKPEIDLDANISPYDSAVYSKGAENLHRLIREGVFVQDEKTCFYLYQQVMGEHRQIGLVACASVEEYDDNRIKKHELTRVDKEDDRLNHILHLRAQTGPVFLTYVAKPAIDELFQKISRGEPEYDFLADDGIRHTLWVVKDTKQINTIESEFATIDVLYVADGHHRSAAASRACKTMKENNKSHTGDEEYNYFLTVIFPHNQMQILDYNRVVKDLSGLNPDTFLNRLQQNFLVRPADSEEGYRPQVRHDFGMYVAGNWYRLSAIPGSWNDIDPTKRLDVSILYENILKPILGIEDQRTDKRIDFVGGIRGLKELSKRVNSGEMAVAFSLFPTGIKDLMAIADANQIMPPKSTWFEPKLRSGLVIHLLD